MRSLRQGWKLALLGATLALITASATPLAHAAAAKAASATKSGAPRPSARSKSSLRQFTGVVTALDKTGITVEKSGKKPKTMVFAKHAEMRTTGDVAKDARVTVFYREDGGHIVAHRVVVKPETAAPRGGQ